MSTMTTTRLCRSTLAAHRSDIARIDGNEADDGKDVNEEDDADDNNDVDEHEHENNTAQR